MEKHDCNEQDANNMAEFLIPLFDFVPKKMSTATQCLRPPWMSASPRALEPSLTTLQLDAMD